MQRSTPIAAALVAALAPATLAGSLDVLSADASVNLGGPGTSGIGTGFSVTEPTVAGGIGTKLILNGQDGLARRDHLIEENDHVDHPRGELAYHIELLNLFSPSLKLSPIAARSHP